jgi:hypothetical protein
MRRLVVGFAVLCLAAATLGVTGSAPAGAGVPGFTVVSTANAYSFAADHPFDGTFCVGGVVVSNPATTEVGGPFTLASGSTDVRFYNSGTALCTDTPLASATVVLPDQGVVTLMAYWGGSGAAVVMLVDPLDCVAIGRGRLTIRNGADVGSGGAVDIYGAGPDGIDTLLLAGVPATGQASVDLPVGTYTNVRAVEAGTLNPVVTIGSLIVAQNSVGYDYLYGGNDGAVGAFAGGVAEVSACAAVTTTTTAAPATTAPPAAAPAVQATPAFTG